jgi:hypothetical protein
MAEDEGDSSDHEQHGFDPASAVIPADKAEAVKDKTRSLSFSFRPCLIACFSQRINPPVDSGTSYFGSTDPEYSSYKPW